jgi:Do/DeqQ family serine protease
MMRRLAVLLLFVSLGFVAGMVLTGAMRSADTAVAAPQAESDQAVPGRAPQGPPALQNLPDLTGIAERAVQAVTSITSTSTIQNPYARDPIYRFLYGDQMLERQAQSLGSGVIVSRDGYVVTNHHVIDSGSSRPQVSVILADKRELAAKIVGTDEQTDLAILKVDATNLPTIPWGDSGRIRVAEWVLAIGNPFGVFSQTVTLGIVSATGRSVEALNSPEEFIQTDAAINRGNSGGALINARGELVGINTAIYSETGGYQGIGLAVPSNLVRSTMDQLIKDGAVRRGTILGIRLQQMTPQIAEQLGAPDTRGILIVRVDIRSNAYAAGLRVGDVITEINGKPVEGAQGFIRQLSDTPIGSTATLTLIRDGRRATARVEIDERRPQRIR